MSPQPPAAKPPSTLGLTGLTVNAMALIAPGAFLWLTFQIQALYGAPLAGSAMWFGIVLALALCFATAKIQRGIQCFYAAKASGDRRPAYCWRCLARLVAGSLLRPRSQRMPMQARPPSTR